MPLRNLNRAFLIAAVAAFMGAMASAQGPASMPPQPAAAAAEVPGDASRIEPDARSVLVDDLPENLATLARLDRAMVTVAGDHKLIDTLNSLRDQSHMNLMVNWTALAAAGIDKNTPVGLTLTNVSLGNALRMLLNETSLNLANLDYTVDGGIIVVSTRDDLNSSKYTVLRMYNVRDLLALPPDQAALAAAEKLGGPADAPTPQQLRDARVEYFMETIEGIVAPDSWRQAGGTAGSMREYDGVLIVTQTRENQHAIARFLAQLRAARGAATQGASQVSR